MKSRISESFWVSKDITDVIQDQMHLLEFLVSLGHLPPHTDTAQWTSHDDNNNNQMLEIKSHSDQSNSLCNNELLSVAESHRCAMIQS